MSHPTQYHSPWFRKLASLPQLDVEVMYCFQPDAEQQGKGFGIPFEWDISLLDGYPSRFLTNVARHPGFHFSGCDTPEVSAVIATSSYDAVLISGWHTKSYWQAMRASWRRGRPMMIRGDSHLLGRRHLHVRVAKRVVLGRWIPRFAAYLTVGTLNEQYYEFYGAKKERFYPVRHFVDNQAFESRAELARSNISQIRNQWRLSDRSLVVLFVGKFIEFKRPLDVIKAVECRANAGDDIHLLMVGDGPLKSDCQRYASENGIPVTFAGFLNQGRISEAYCCSHVLVLPSNPLETWGLVVNEAMASGLSAIVTDKVGCGPDLVRQGESGAIYPVGDVVALAAELGKCVADRQMVRERGIQAKRRVADFSIDNAAAGTLRAVSEIATAGS